MSTKYLCTDCKTVLNRDSLTSENRSRCPKCRSTSITIFEEFIEEITAKDETSVLGKRDEEIFASRSEDTMGRITSVDKIGEDSFSIKRTGKSPQNEENSKKVSLLLITKLNESGFDWVPQEFDDEAHDCIAIDKTDKSKKLFIQVVNVVVDPDFHEHLGNKRSLEVVVSKEELINQIKDAIRYKLKTDHTNTTLALDATLWEATCFPDIVKEFKSKLGDWVKAQDFKSVWLVGPTKSLIQRLDTS